MNKPTQYQKAQLEIAAHGYEMHIASYGYRVYPKGEPRKGIPFTHLKEIVAWCTSGSTHIKLI